MAFVVRQVDRLPRTEAVLAIVPPGHAKTGWHRIPSPAALPDDIRAADAAGGEVQAFVEHLGRHGAVTE